MTRKVLATAAALAAYLVAIPFLLRDSPYLLGVVTTASMLSFISLGVWLTFAIGRINIGQAAFALIGGYVTAVMTTAAGASFWLALPDPRLLAALLALVIVWPLLRLPGVLLGLPT